MNALASWIRQQLGHAAEDGADPNSSRWPLLEKATTPEGLRSLPARALPWLAEELREFLVESVSRSGGHLSSGLGTVELAVALHRVFNTPDDALIWDVGHQAYPHKALTGRREDLHRIRQRGGPSGFLRRSESKYDAFGAGHSSTSISAALGMALANRQLGLPHKSVAIIGDGALSAGLAYEALDHAGATSADLLVIVNDNAMSISPSVGAISNYLARQVREHGTSGRGIKQRPPRLLEIAERFERRENGMLLSGQWFEDLGFNYSGPVDGHDLPALLQQLQALRQMTGPRLLHVVTRKGQGYAPAEAEPIRYHGVTPFDSNTGIVPGKASARTFTQVFGDWICDAARRDQRVVALTPAMREGSGLVEFEQQFPDRYHDVGIAEQHCVTLAGGMATRGMRPVVAIYSTFLQRAYDQLIHDVALQNLPVVFAIDRAGLVGPDGASHNGAFDLSYLRCIPNMVVMTPANGTDLRAMLEVSLGLDGPSAVRYPRTAADTSPGMESVPVQVGRSRVVREGSGIALLVFGTLLPTALKVAEELDATVIDMRFVKPLDEAEVLNQARRCRLLVTVEENAVAGGAGSAVSECLQRHAVTVQLLQLGLPDDFPGHGTRDEVLRDAGLDAASIREKICERLMMRGP